MSAIGNCPWCGGEAKADPIPEWYVECTSAECMASGPFSETRDLAIAAWNRIATPGQGEVPTDLAALAALAREATAQWGDADRIEAIIGGDCDSRTFGLVRAYIAAANPAVVLGLINELRRLRAAVAWVRGE